MSAFATFGGVRVVTLSLTIPLYGSWTADVDLATDTAVPQTTALVVGNLTLAGYVARDVAFAGKRMVRAAAGSGGWRKTVGRQQWQSDGGVQLSMVLGDTARAVGERIDVGDDRSIGRDWVRRAGDASATLRRLAGATWRIDEAGTTRLSPWPARSIRTPFTAIDWAGAPGVVEIATEDYAAWLPGATFQSALVSPAQTVAGVSLAIDGEGVARLRVMTVQR